MSKARTVLRKQDGEGVRKRWKEIRKWVSGALWLTVAHSASLSPSPSVSLSLSLSLSIHTREGGREE
jgi:hypothetical protein